MTIILEKAFFLRVNPTFFFSFSHIICSVTTYTSFPFTILWWWSCFSTENVEIQERNFIVFLPPDLALFYMCILIFCLSSITVDSLSSSLRMNFLHIYTLIAFHPQRMWPKKRTVIVTSISFFMNILVGKYIYKY